MKSTLRPAQENTQRTNGESTQMYKIETRKDKIKIVRTILEGLVLLAVLLLPSVR